MQSCEGFSSVQDHLKAKESLLEKEQQHHILGLEHDHFHDCLAWVQRYYSNVPYLQTGMILRMEIYFKM